MRLNWTQSQCKSKVWLDSVCTHSTPGCNLHVKRIKEQEERSDRSSVKDLIGNSFLLLKSD